MRRVFAILVLVLAPLVATAQPQLQLEPTSLDFGELNQHETRNATITMSNVGTETLTIDRVEPTCGCMVPEFTAYELAPGQSVAMNLQFNSQDFDGRQFKILKIHTDDPRHRMVDFQVLAMIRVPLSMRPSSTTMRFPTVKGDEKRTITYTFMAESVDELEITPVTWPESWLDIRVKKGSNPKAKTVDFTVHVAGPAGVYREMVTLRTNIPEMPEIRLEADVRMAGELILGMDKVRFNRVKPGQELEMRVGVAAASAGTEFELTGAEIDIPGLTATVENGTDSAAVLSGNALAADDPAAIKKKGRIAGTLTIHTSLASTPVLQVPVTYMLRR